MLHIRDFIFNLRSEFECIAVFDRSHMVFFHAHYFRTREIEFEITYM